MTYQVIKTTTGQTLPPLEWVELTPGRITPPDVEVLQWLVQLHLTLPPEAALRPTYVKLQWCRHPAGAPVDTTGTTTLAVPTALTSWQGSTSWTFHADPDVKISVRAYHNAPASLVSPERQVKYLTIPAAS
jgi:hypothetical protein